MYLNPLILFDGVCNLCNGLVDFLLKHDRKKQFRFVALQSESGRLLNNKFKIPKNSDSIILIYENHVYFESDAALKIISFLPFPWRIMYILKIIPKRLRDKIYQWVARNRYKWFGKKESCRIPTQTEKSFFPDIQALNKIMF